MMKWNLSNIKTLKKDIPWLFIIILAFMLSVWHSFYCLEITDESYFLALADAIWKGAKPFVDIWAMHQTSAIILLPFVALWHLFTGGTDGIILGVRILYAIVQLSVALYTYFELRKSFSCIRCYACLAALFCQMTSVLGLQILNYNALALLFGQLCFLQLLVLSIQVTSLRIFILGLFGGLLVQSYPTMLIIYVMILAYIIFIVVYRHRQHGRNFEILYFFLGSALAVIAFFCILFICGVTPLDVLRNMPYILSPDRSGDSSSINKMAKLIDEFFIYANLLGKIILPVLSIIAIMLRMFAFRQKKSNYSFGRQNILTSIFVMASLGFVIYWDVRVIENLPSHPLTNYAPPFIVFGHTIILLFCLLAEPGRGGLKLINTVTGILFSLFFWIAMHFASDGGIRMSAVGLTFFMEYYIIRMGVLTENEKKLDKVSLWKLHFNTQCIRGIGIIIVIVALCSLGGSRVLGHYRENDLRDLDMKIRSGPAKGIMTTSVNADNYYAMLEAADYACANATSLAVEIYYPLAYLSQDCVMHSYTTGRIAISSKRLDLWYEVHDYQLPDAVIIYKNDYNQWQWCDDNDITGYLGTSISSGNFVKTELLCANVYTCIENNP